MLVGALADAGADRQSLVSALDSLGTQATLRFEQVKRCGIAATKFHVDIVETRTHRHLPHILKMINAAPPAGPRETKRVGGVSAARRGGGPSTRFQSKKFISTRWAR
jgi:uncharacterized protein (DUF111 family)